MLGVCVGFLNLGQLNLELVLHQSAYHWFHHMAHLHGFYAGQVWNLHLALLGEDDFVGFATGCTATIA